MEAGLNAQAAQLDWDRPWLQPYRDIGRALTSALLAGQTVAQALDAQATALGLQLHGRPMRFVEQQALPEGEAYEAFIHRSACIPTRENWHDFFNGLVWLHWLDIKAQFNLMHMQHWRNGLTAAEADAAEPGSAPSPRHSTSDQTRSQARGRIRDALTVLDENGAWLQAPAELTQRLRQRQWQELFVQHRPAWAQARLIIIGHALLEKLMQPRKPMCAHVLCAPDRDGFRHAIDELPLQLQATATKPWHPLPVLGIPGWCAENMAADFYDDRQVFRA